MFWCSKFSGVVAPISLILIYECKILQCLFIHPLILLCKNSVYYVLSISVPTPKELYYNVLHEIVKHVVPVVYNENYFNNVLKKGFKTVVTTTEDIPTLNIPEFAVVLVQVRRPGI